MSPPGVMTAWWLAARPKTLAAGIVPVLVGTAVAQMHGGFQLLPAFACIIGSLLIQIATNLANDYFDHKKGADTEARIGPARAVQKGWIAPRTMAIATLFCLTLALLVGLYLINIGGWPIAAIGVASLVCAVAYTGGPVPLAYVGLGDLFVFLFFGLAAVGGTVFVQLLYVPQEAWIAGACIGLLATAILVVNNLRDRETDEVANKRTLAVRFGPKVARTEHMLCLIMPYVLIGGAVMTGIAPLGWLVTFVSLPLAVKEVRDVNQKDGPALNVHLAGAARVELVFGLLLCVGSWQ